MGDESGETPGQPDPRDDFIAELRHWREVAGVSQKALAAQVGYDASYISKVESGTQKPSRAFAESVDQRLKAGRAIFRRWLAMQDAEAASGHKGVHSGYTDDPQSAPSNALMVEHEHAELTYDEGVFHTHVRRQLRNVGTEPVTRYLIRIAVDHFPGDPDRSNRLYRENPLTWEEINLTALCGDEPMTWHVKHDRDAFKELWLLFENGDGKFPLYPGETTWIQYDYTVTEEKWGPWWQRAIRLPTRRLSLAIVLPTELQPVVWGMETSMTAEATAFRTPIVKEARDDLTTFRWSTDDPPLHARYRIEWKFKNQIATGQNADMDVMSPSEKMVAIGIVQEGEPVLAEVARPFDLPAEAEDARRVVAQLVSTMERVSQVHTFAKGMGIAAPQIGIGRAAAVVRTPNGQILTLLNPRIIDESSVGDEFYEGCLSFFDVRGKVPRSRTIEVEHQDVNGTTHITEFSDGVSRLVQHEVDHLYGILYKARMRPGVEPIPVAQYRGTGQDWAS